MIRFLIACGALCGLGGVALSAVARHASKGEHLQTASQFLLLHAPALLALAALLAAGYLHDTLGRAAGIAMLLGLLLFCGDLASRDFLGRPLFSNAAPTGGMILMAGWAAVAIAALLPRG